MHHLPVSRPYQVAQNQVCLASSDLLHMHLALAGTRLNDYYYHFCVCWMRKLHVCGVAGMIALLQKLLQLYAAKTCSHGDQASSQNAIDQVIAADEAEWTQLVKQMLQSNATTDAALLEDLQKRMESTVLGQTSGSYVQRVQVDMCCTSVHVCSLC